MTPRARILVVDDQEINRDMLSRRLQRREFAVTAVASGEAALAQLERDAFDLVLLDIAMPGLSGLDVLKQVRSRWSPIELPVIMVTARSESTGVVEALELGANDYVTKPVDFPVALARIQTHLDLHRRDAALRDSEERYALAVRGTNDGVWDWKLDSGEVYFSPRWRTILGFEDASATGRIEDWHALVHPADLEQLVTAIAGTVDGGASRFECEHRMLHRDGSYRWVLARGIVVRDPAGRASRLAGSISDVTEARVVDALTGLPNRVLLLDRLDRLIERARRHPSHAFAVLFVDVDRFRLMNDSLGHQLADELLLAFARRLAEHLRSADSISRSAAGGHTLARLRGDEFTILLEQVENVSGALRVAERIHDLLATPFVVGGREIVLTASIGVAMSRNGAASADDLLRDAAMAMESAREHGKGRVEVFESGMRVRALHRLERESDLRRAVGRGDLRVHYQPIVSLSSGAVIAFEALVRWQGAEGVRQPGDFLQTAEDSGLMLPITEFVLRDACESAERWTRISGIHPPPAVSVNISPRLLQEHDVAALVRDALQATGLNPRLLHLEITETAMLGTAGDIESRIAALLDTGAALSLDDFGTGYSSLSYLHRFPVRTIKIDRSFVHALDRPENRAIVRSIVLLGDHLRMEVVAEGIETAEQLRELAALGCSAGQGYLLGRPAVEPDAAELLKKAGGRVWPFETANFEVRSPNERRTLNCE